jgi:serine/threonine protein kinase
MFNKASIHDNMLVLNQKPDSSRQVLRKAKLMQYHVQMA